MISFSSFFSICTDQQRTSLERLKSEYLHNWLQDMCKTHIEVFVGCLMPHPVEHARVGGHWYVKCSYSTHTHTHTQTQ